jgi:hypothetical protein
MATQVDSIDGRSALDAALRTDFLSFLMKVFAELCPGDRFSHALYLEAIAYHLERISDGDIRRLMVTIPPRHLNPSRFRSPGSPGS